MEYENAIEWIPFDKLIITDKIGEGGFGCVYSATWSDGMRKIEKTDDRYYVISREPSSVVALKILSDSSLKEIFTVVNILQHKGISENMISYISDMGLSKNVFENDSEGCIYGVIPYVAPEVLSGQKFTKEADIYGFGVIMSEMSTGQRPFDGYRFNEELAVKICIGLRPEFAPGTPECYIKLANQCMDSDPKK
ncbi:kinase-like domain-containing protein [Gigaspora rosea]|uniref:Kinase-like domain-containing protein n=1 Tax=Gigaspora rosea TaxID=44941 RepID=A0A397UX15_9GLOM|nr:kinase-like domain-containing protein [Gigaspora rosea]